MHPVIRSDPDLRQVESWQNDCSTQHKIGYYLADAKHSGRFLRMGCGSSARRRSGNGKHASTPFTATIDHIAVLGLMVRPLSRRGGGHRRARSGGCADAGGGRAGRATIGMARPAALIARRSDLSSSRRRPLLDAAPDRRKCRILAGIDRHRQRKPDMRCPSGSGDPRGHRTLARPLRLTMSADPASAGQTEREQQTGMIADADRRVSFGYRFGMTMIGDA